MILSAERRGHRPVLDTCANEAIPRQGKGGLINHLYPLLQLMRCSDFRDRWFSSEVREPFEESEKDKNYSGLGLHVDLTYVGISHVSSFHVMSSVAAGPIMRRMMVSCHGVVRLVT